jgi:hypothetical protein
MIAETIPALRALSPEQKFILAAELLRETVNDRTEEPDPGLVEALQERLDYHRQHPDEVLTWEEVKARAARQSKP